jgi:hypothetical protein
MKPDLESAEGRAAYKAELRTVAWGLRWWGFTLLALGAAGLAFHKVQGVPVLNTSEGIASIAALVAGAALMIAGIAARTRYHKKRMAG